MSKPRRIEWRVPGSDVVHTLPSEAIITLEGYDAIVDVSVTKKGSIVWDGDDGFRVETKEDPGDE